MIFDRILVPFAMRTIPSKRLPSRGTNPHGINQNKTKQEVVRAIIIPLLVVATVEKKTTKNVVEYFPALAR